MIILGASSRAAAFSAVAAGLTPACADLFADDDLTQQAHAIQVDDYPHGLLAAARLLPKGPWMYTGALENYPQLVDSLSQERTLYGNGRYQLEQVRDPLVVQDAFAACGLKFPLTKRMGDSVLQNGDSVPRDGSWLCKPLRSSGGDRIVPWADSGTNVTTELTAEELSADEFFLQERKEGLPCSAVFVAHAGGADLLGATRQIIGADWTGADGFRYAGSIGPLPLTKAQREQLTIAGREIATRFQLTGLFGIDYLQDGDELWFIEINPRYPASAEVLERATGLCFVAAHVVACTGRYNACSVRKGLSVAATQYCGKVIIFAEEDFTLTPTFSKWASDRNANSDRYVVADIPPAGSAIPAKAPIATVLAEGRAPADIEHQLQERADELKQMTGSLTTTL